MSILMLRATLPATVLLLAPTALAASNDDPAVTWRTIAVTGQPAPGTGEGVTFLAFTTALNHSIMAPRIDGDGRLAFIALITGPGVGEGNQSGLWRDGADGVQLVVRTGDPAPGTPAGVVFFGVPSEYLPFPPQIGDGRLQFQGELTGPGIDSGNQSGLWRERPDGSIALIARSADPAPGLPGLTCTGPIGGTIADSGTSVLIGGVNGPGVTTENNDVIWSDRDGTMGVLMREGDPAPGTPPGVVIGRGTFGTPTTFPATVTNAGGRALVAANLLGPGLDAFDDEALFLENQLTGAPELVIREGDHAPGFAPNVTIGGNSVLAMIRDLDLNDAGHLLFTCRLGGAIPTTTCAFTDRGGALAPVMPLGTALPGAAVGFGEGGPGSLLLNDADQIAFTHQVPDGDGDFHTVSYGIWSDRDGSWAPVLLPGDVVTHDGRTLVVTSASSLGFNGAGEILASVSLDDPEIGWRSGLVLLDTGGAAHVVAATGDDFDLAGDGTDVREVIRVTQGGLAASGAVAFRLDFADDTSAHLTASLRDCNGDGLEDGGQIADGSLVDLDGDGVPDVCTAPTCPADLTGDGSVGVADLVELVMAWGSRDVAADLDGDGRVAVGDLVLLIQGWGACG